MDELIKALQFYATKANDKIVFDNSYVTGWELDLGSRARKALKSMENTQNPTEQWAVYERPLDYPDQFIARRWIIEDGEPKPTNDIFLAPTLSSLRSKLPGGLLRIPRFKNDDKTIVEVWI